MASRKEERKARQQRRRWPLFVTLPVLTLLVAAIMVGAGLALAPLPQPSLPEPTLVYDRHGQLIARLSQEHRIPIPYSQIPDWMKKAIVATEDKTFWHNPGIDPAAILRAALVDLRAGRIVEGGSTITQQLVKNLYLTPTRSFERKFVEAFLTLKLAWSYPKTKILNLYLNTVYFGQGAYGLEEAAKTYFGIHARTLNLPQAALLAGLVNAPSYFDPYQNPSAALARRATVLDRMVAVGYLSPTEAVAAKNAPLDLVGLSRSPTRAPYFVDAAVQEIRNRDPLLARELYQGGYRVYTTLDLRLQQDAEAAFQKELLPGVTEKSGITEPEAALIALDPRTGYVEALLGGRSYRESPFDRAIAAHRQPGSAFKPFLYTALLATKRYTAASIMDDSPVRFPAGGGRFYEPHNAGNRRLGPVPVRRALEVSDNVIAVKWAYILGINRVRYWARRLGIESPLNHNLTLVLGSSAVTPLEMATAYAPFANGGYRVHPRFVTRVTDRYGDTLLRLTPRVKRVLSPQVAYIITDLLESVLGPHGTAANLPTLTFPAAAKTGTSNKNRDGWLVGYAPNLVAAVWVGYDRPHPLPGEGATTAGPVWDYFMRRAEEKHPPSAFPKPSGLVRLPICTLDGLLPNETSPTRPEYFIAGTEPTEISPIAYDGPDVTWPPDPGRWYYQYFPKPFAARLGEKASG